MINELWKIAPEWADDIRDAEGSYGLGLIFTNNDKRFCSISDIEDDDYDCGTKDYLRIIPTSIIVSFRPKA
ncbi:MAG TPA: hypothetical protein DDW91_02950 [Shewanella frigidimarina]|nr:hypothetical protein [Shewanella frigidimarina]